MEIETERIKQEIKSNKELPEERMEQLLKKVEDYEDVIIAATGISGYANYFPFNQEIGLRRRAINALHEDIPK